MAVPNLIRRLIPRSALALAVIVPGAWLVHIELVKSAPGKDEIVKEAPKALQLWFSGKPDLDLTTVTLLKADNTPVARVTMEAGKDTTEITGKIPVAVAEGDYTVSWRSTSKDGHVAKGRYNFSYRKSAATDSAAKH